MMSATDRARLGTVRPELASRATQLFDVVPTLGLSVMIPEFGGARTNAQQTALYADSLAQGGGALAYPVAVPGTSRHEYGAAFDVNIVGDGASDAGYRDLADAGAALGLTAGYYFDRSDPYHFQLNEPLQTSIDRWQATRVSVGLLLVGLVVAAGLTWLTLRKH